MKKIILTVGLLVGLYQTSFTQVHFGVKGGINYNSNTIEEISTDVFEGGSNKAGYHAGLWLRLKVPVLGIYVRPEIVYTALESEMVYKASSKTTNYSFQKIDIPVLFGKKIFGVGNIFVGPSFQYVLNSGFDINDISEVTIDDFTTGIQLGGGVEFGKIGIDIRWERGLSGIESKLVQTSLGNTIQFDTRVNQIIIGLSLRL